MKLIMENWRKFLSELEVKGLPPTPPVPPKIKVNREMGQPAKPKPDIFDSGAQDWQILLQPS